MTNSWRRPRIRCSVGLGTDDEVWVPTVFSKNRDRLLDHGTTQEFFRSVLEQARGQSRSNETHASVTDPDTRLYKKAPGEASRLAYLGHVLMDNRHGLIAAEQVATADGTAEVEAAVQLVDDLGGNQRNCHGSFCTIWSRIQASAARVNLRQAPTGRPRGRFPRLLVPSLLARANQPRIVEGWAPDTLAKSSTRASIRSIALSIP